MILKTVSLAWFFTALASATSFATITSSTKSTPVSESASAAAAPASLPATTTFGWLHTQPLGPNTPVPTLTGRLLSVDQFSYTKYRVTCKQQDEAAGCTYKDFILTVSGNEQLYYEHGGNQKSVSCNVGGTTTAVCFVRTHGQALSAQTRLAWNQNDFPGYWPVVITEDVKATRSYEQDFYFYGEYHSGDGYVARTSTPLPATQGAGSILGISSKTTNGLVLLTSLILIFLL